MKGAENLIQSLPEVSICQDSAYGDEGHALFEGNGAEFLIQGFSDMFENPFCYVFFSVFPGLDIPLHFCLRPGEAEDRGIW